MGVETKRGLGIKQDKVGLGCISCPGRGCAARTVCPAWEPRQRLPSVGTALQHCWQSSSEQRCHRERGCHSPRSVTDAITVLRIRLWGRGGMLSMVTDKLYMQVSLTLSTLIPNLCRTALKPPAPSFARSCVLSPEAPGAAPGECLHKACWLLSAGHFSHDLAAAGEGLGPSSPPTKAQLVKHTENSTGISISPGSC